MSDTVDAARWRMAMHYMTAHNRFIVEGLIPDELPDAAPQGANEPPSIGTGYKPQAPAVAAPPQMPGLEAITQLPLPDEQHFHHTASGRVQELDSRYAQGWNDAIEAAAVYCSHTLANNHVASSSYFRHAAINIRTLRLK